MPVRYSKFNGDTGPAIKSCRDHVDLARIHRTIERENYKMDSEIVINNKSFQDIYDNWIEPIVALMATVLGEKIISDDKVKEMCYSDSEEIEQNRSAFLLNYIDFIKGVPPFHEDYVLQNTPSDNIIEFIDQVCNDKILRFRYKLVCILTGFLPDDMFLQTINSTAASYNDLLEVNNNDVFEVELEPTDTLIAKTLVNNNPNPIVFLVKYGSKEYKVTLPGNGFIAAVFNQNDKLLSLKGNISLSQQKGSSYCCAVIRLNDDGMKKIFTLERYSTTKSCISTDPNIIDCAGNLEGTVNYICNGKVYSTCDTNNIIYDEQGIIPIRVYSTIIYEAIQYSDGTLKTNMRNGYGSIKKAYSVTVQDERNMCFCDESGAWKCVNGREAEKIEKEEFIDIMMERFATDGCCERFNAIDTLGKELAIKKNGKLGSKEVGT